MTTPPLGTAARAVHEAKRWLGYKEGPNNRTVFGGRTGYQNQPWCGSFTDCVLKDAGVRKPGSSVWTPGGATAYQKAKRWYSTPKVGDEAYFDFPNDGVDRISHVEIVIGTSRWKSHGEVTTIGGNTSSGMNGSQRNGDGVYQRTRYKRDIEGFGRPFYKVVATPAPKPAPKPAAQPLVRVRDVQPGKRNSSVALVQKALIKRGYSIPLIERGLAKFGFYGSQTKSAYAAFQRALGYRGRAADGKPGIASLTALGKRAGFRATK